MATVASRSRKSNRQDAYQVVTDRIIELLDKEIVPWHRPWGGQAAVPRSAATKKVYRGINLFLLHCMQREQPLWITYKQAQNLGGQVRKGEKGTPVVFWKFLDVVDKETGEEKEIPLLRRFTVFNVEQCDSLPDKLYEVEVQAFEHDPIESAQAIVDGAPAFKVEVGGFKASFNPAADVIAMPEANRFESRQHYYSTLFHELIHWTGHASRLNREADMQFGSSGYAFEELVAEMGANMLCGHAGILHHTIDNSVSYIDSWRRRLQADPKIVVQAAGKAQKAVDYILGTTFDD